jgi:hypothetical protein
MSGEKADPIRPIHDAIRESLASIEIVFSPTLPSFQRDRIQTPGGKERSVAAFLKSYFPHDWSVKKGPIYDQSGNVSAEVDCAICIPQHPPCRTPKRDLILAEGVHAAIEVKPDISTLGDDSEFARSLRQAKSVKNLNRKISFSNPEKTKLWPKEIHRIPYCIFADKVAEPERSIQFVEKQGKKNGWDSWDLPDIIFGYNNWLVFHAADAGASVITEYLCGKGHTSGEYYLLFETGKDTLIFVLSLLYSFISPQPLLVEPILRQYLLPLDISSVKVFQVREGA